jgi:purine-nucleoside phosphorylase
METISDMAAAPNAYARATETAKYVRSQLPEALQYPKVAIVCGSGLGGLAETIESEPKVELAYGTIPNFPKSTGECRTWKHALVEGEKLGIAQDAGY